MDIQRINVELKTNSTLTLYVKMLDIYSSVLGSSQVSGFTENLWVRFGTKQFLYVDEPMSWVEAQVLFN